MKEVAVFVCSTCKETFDSRDGIACHILNTHNTDKTVKKLRNQLAAKNAKPTKLKPSHRLLNSSLIDIKKQKNPSQKVKVKKYRREFYCDICDYKTVYRSTYTRHLLIHEKGGRQHKCKYCSYAAVQSHNLKVHINSVHPFGAVEPVIVQ